MQRELEPAIATYQGPLLPACYDEWIIPHRVQFQERYYHCLERMVALMEQRGRYQEAIYFAEMLLKLEPLRESIYRQLMRLHVANADRAGALRVYHTCARVLKRELAVEPSVATRRVFEELFNLEDPDLSTIPPEPTPFVGRKKDLEKIIQLLQSEECSLLTLTGQGGVGKTRLAIQVALRVESQPNALFPDGVHFIPLNSATSGEVMVPVIAEGIGFTFYRPTDPETQLADYLRGKRKLFILDTFEHLIGKGEAIFLSGLLKEAGGVKLLVTSRARLNINAEWVYQVEGMSHPAMSGGRVGQDYDAIQLFAANASRARSNFSLSAENTGWVAHICRLVEGNPLALELAAAWVKVLSCEEIGGEIEANLDFLSATHRDVSGGIAACAPCSTTACACWAKMRAGF